MKEQNRASFHRLAYQALSTKVTMFLELFLVMESAKKFKLLPKPKLWSLHLQ